MFSKKVGRFFVNRKDQIVMGVLPLVAYTVSYFVFVNPKATALTQDGKLSCFSACMFGKRIRIGGLGITAAQVHWTNYFYAPIDLPVRYFVHATAHTRQ